MPFYENWHIMLKKPTYSIMKPYLAKLIFNIAIEDTGDTQFDEQTCLINAQDSSDAFIKAQQRGKEKEEVFMNKANKRVSWNFIDVAELYALEDFKDGEELFAATCEHEHAQSYIQFVHQKSAGISATLQALC